MTQHDRTHIIDVLSHALARHPPQDDSANAAFVEQLAFDFVIRRFPRIGSEDMTAEDETRLRIQTDEVVDNLCQIIAAAISSRRGDADAIDP